MAGSRWSRRVVARVAAVLAIAACALCIPARAAFADEALLPDSEDDVEWEEESDPTDTGVAPIGCEPNEAQLTGLLDAYFEQNFSASGIPGMVVAVVNSDGVLYERALGDVDSVDDTFIIGSLSKSMTSAAVQQLVDAGLIDLDAPAVVYAPEFDLPASVTVRSLLNQSSGFGCYESLGSAQVGETEGVFSYANANYDLLGRIVQNVSGMSYGTYLRRYLFDPLGMTDASVDGEAACAPAATGHRTWFGLPVADGFTHEQGDGAWGGPASGYVRASISDMASYLRMYLNSGSGVLSSAAIHRMVYDRVPDPWGDSFYGMGWTTYHWGDGELVMSHDGDVENYVARMCIIPGRDLGIVLLADVNDAVEGNSVFWQMGDYVTSLAVGGQAAGVDAESPRMTHVFLNLSYLLAVGVCAGSLVLCVRGRRRSRRPRDKFELTVRVVRVIFLHGFLPAAILLYPTTFGMRPRDFAAFFPEQALVGIVCAVLLILGGLAQLRLLRRAPARSGVV